MRVKDIKEYKEFIELVVSEDFAMLDKQERGEIKKIIIDSKSEVDFDEQIIIEKTKYYLECAQEYDSYKGRFERLYGLLSKKSKFEIAKEYFLNCKIKDRNCNENCICRMITQFDNDNDKIKLITFASESQIYKLMMKFRSEGYTKKCYKLCQKALERKKLK